jgi:hypothetical protein
LLINGKSPCSKNITSALPVTGVVAVLCAWLKVQLVQHVLQVHHGAATALTVQRVHERSRHSNDHGAASGPQSKGFVCCAQ